ncbi:MAG TPA: hypothetical protein VGO45_01095 [Bacteroidia bacterium]|jgi:predicted transcriptional regulator|nr:hypothetical protein [Bacteroidia bacterium]
MSTSELKYTLFRAIDTINDNKTLKDIYSFISKKTKTDFWESLSKDQKEEIEKALKELDSGAGVPHEKVMAKYKGKYV